MDCCRVQTGRKPSFMDMVILAEPEHKKCTEIEAGTGYLGDIDYLCRDGVRKAKAHLKLKLGREAEDNRRGFLCKYTGSKRQAKERWGPLPSEIRDPVGREK